MKLAHISDLHFNALSLSPLQFFSKRWLGNLNLVLSRKKNFITDRLNSLIELFQSLGVEHVIISGDLSTTSYEKEFELASQFIKQFNAVGIEVLALPGNHDQYTQRAFKQRLFYQYFDAKFSEEKAFNLRDHGVTATSLAPKWWFIALDTAIATSIVSSRGYFSPKTEAHLEELLALIPSDHNILLANHFPFFEQEGPRKSLGRAKALRDLVRRHPNIRLYLHGHTHRHCIADLRSNGFPIILDSGSTSHSKTGSWNFLDISPSGCEIKAYKWDPESPAQWSISKQSIFQINRPLS